MYVVLFTVIYLVLPIVPTSYSGLVIYKKNASTQFNFFIKKKTYDFEHHEKRTNNYQNMNYFFLSFLNNQ